MTKAELRIIRQRLGWSTAEMARRLGEDSAHVAAIEAGERPPGPSVLNQYHFLLHGLDVDAESIRQTPHAERHLESEGLAQVTHRELLNER